MNADLRRAGRVLLLRAGRAGAHAPGTGGAAVPRDRIGLLPARGHAAHLFAGCAGGEKRADFRAKACAGSGRGGDGEPCLPGNPEHHGARTEPDRPDIRREHDICGNRRKSARHQPGNKRPQGHGHRCLPQDALRSRLLQPALHRHDSWLLTSKSPSSSSWPQIPSSVVRDRISAGEAPWLASMGMALRRHQQKTGMDEIPEVLYTMK